ncbi:septum formation protein Maf, variant [Spizellomyces punctatus DAOM BR117]|uniref:Septum formation protein Maf, variant n=1 Tax=Spizellomyces punctatus (strain DAOM BR117) TaxID=645134 RepID=A0A0L0HA88_SPIPD|nr:septum formation protein Maf, variant [Spizellomyces punctatus DAOM BR117]KNC98062.1 septum formation protein Maf, variant [Spizellomyces punctatus DAOM BR117]|eukprot:XP_016606102.1 septum formation protein Maf, variant [Spizellomyces punctatus DAOM BR117]
MLPAIAQLNTRNVILASGSPRRKEILERLGVKFNINPSTFPEDLNKTIFSNPNNYVTRTALEKGLQVYQSLTNTNPLVISADTIIVLDDQILEKPVDAAHAKRILSSLSGRVHEVLTAIVVVFGVSASGQPLYKTAVERTLVEFGVIGDAVIDAYVETGEPMDKVHS